LTQTEIVVTRQLHFNARELEQFREIYTDSFPASERGDFGALIQHIAEGRRWCFGAAVGGDLIGIVVVLPFILSDIHLGEYFAVRRDLRNQNIGAQFLLQVVAMMASEKNARGMIFEVESDDDAAGDEQRLRARRIAFYLRNGARRIDGVSGYRVPNLAGADTLAMKLMWFPFAPASPAPQGARLQDCIRAIFIKSYGLSSDDPLIQSVLKNVH
jgi:GNAT superfamily N-acetyltransferase